MKKEELQNLGSVQKARMKLYLIETGFIEICNEVGLFLSEAVEELLSGMKYVLENEESDT